MIEFATPPSNVIDFVNAFHDGKEVCFRRMYNIIVEAEVPGVASRCSMIQSYCS